MPENDNVIVRLLGGLGNQMFQYAAGRALAMSLGKSLLLDRTLLDDHRPGVHQMPRSYRLDVFSLKGDFAGRAHIRHFRPGGPGLWKKIVYRLRRELTARGLLPARLRAMEMIEETGFRFDPRVFQQPPSHYLSGFWQSYRYFDAIDAQLRSDFSFRHPLAGQAVDLAERIGREDAVLLHVRRGDYLTVPISAVTNGFVGLDYYERAVSLMREKIARPTFFVFSDDLDWCREHLPSLGGPFEYVALDAPAGVPQDGFELQLMSCARHFIIANSTFSWWSAWLAGTRARHVIAPARWFTDSSLDTSELSPPHWQLV